MIPSPNSRFRRPAKNTFLYIYSTNLFESVDNKFFEQPQRRQAVSTRKFPDACRNLTGSICSQRIQHTAPGVPYAASGLLPGSSPHGKSPAAPSKLCGGRFPLLYQQTAQRASAAFILAAERPSCMAFSSAQIKRACRPLRAGDKPSVSLIRFYCAISARKLSVNPGQLHAPHP